MARKLSFALITLFWVAMNALLWRAEFAGDELGATTPVALVWEKILTSPDDSGLAVNFSGERVGYVRWVPNIGEENATGKTANENSEIEGRIKRTTGYSIHADGNFILPDGGGRFRFEFDSKFSQKHDWKEWSLKALQRPHTWKVSVHREKQTIDLRLGEERAALTQTLRFSDLKNPGKLLEAAGIAEQLPALAAVLPNFSGISAGTNSPAMTLGLNWEARQDWLKLGHSRVKVYKLRARILEKYEAIIIVSRVGEILRVELPGELTLVNEALINM